MRSSRWSVHLLCWRDSRCKRRLEHRPWSTDLCLETLTLTTASDLPNPNSPITNNIANVEAASEPPHHISQRMLRELPSP